MDMADQHLINIHTRNDAQQAQCTHILQQQDSQCAMGTVKLPNMKYEGDISNFHNMPREIIDFERKILPDDMI